MEVYVVIRFDPMQCGACGNGNLDKIFTTRKQAERYIRNSPTKKGATWEIKSMPLNAMPPNL